MFSKDKPSREHPIPTCICPKLPETVHHYFSNPHLNNPLYYVAFRTTYGKTIARTAHLQRHNLIQERHCESELNERTSSMEVSACYVDRFYRYSGLAERAYSAEVYFLLLDITYNQTADNNLMALVECSFMAELLKQITVFCMCTY